MSEMLDVAPGTDRSRRPHLTAEEALSLYRTAPTWWLGRMADRVRQRKHPEGIVTYIIDRNVNYTNVCVARCNFCAFYRPVGHGEGYVLAFDEIFRKIDETIALGGVQLLMQGGHNPDLPLRLVRGSVPRGEARYPTFKLHALSPPEVLHLSRMSKLCRAGSDCAAGGRGPRQHSRRRRRDSGRPRPQAAELLRQGDRPTSGST